MENLNPFEPKDPIRRMKPKTAQHAAVGASLGAVVGALFLGPVGAALGGAVGGAIGGRSGYEADERNGR